MSATNPYLGVGLYTLPDAARILRVPAVNVRRWANGYSWKRGEEQRTADPLFGRDAPELAAQGILTFADLVELKLIAMFRSLKFSLQLIRSIAEYTAQRLETRHPLATCRFHTDGSRIFAEWATAARISRSVARTLEEAPSGQLVFGEFAQQFFRKLDYEDDLTIHYWPLGKERGVVLDPRQSFGKPILAASGTPTSVLAEMIRGGRSKQEVAWWYEVDAAAVDAALDYEYPALAA